MASKRSLNKLERKAHMSIHNVVEVTENECLDKGLSYTRDRFGKKHKIDFNAFPVLTEKKHAKP